MGAREIEIEGRDREFLLGVLAGAELGPGLGPSASTVGTDALPRPDRLEAEAAVRVLRAWALRSPVDRPETLAESEDAGPLPSAADQAALFNTAATTLAGVTSSLRAMVDDLSSSNRIAAETHHRIAAQLDRNDRLIAALTR